MAGQAQSGRRPFNMKATSNGAQCTCLQWLLQKLLWGLRTEPGTTHTARAQHVGATRLCPSPNQEWALVPKRAKRGTRPQTLTVWTNGIFYRTHSTITCFPATVKTANPSQDYKQPQKRTNLSLYCFLDKRTVNYFAFSIVSYFLVSDTSLKTISTKSLLSIRMRQLGYWHKEMLHLVILQKECISIINDAFVHARRKIQRLKYA